MSLLLLGDSNGRILKQAANELGLPLLGGFIGPGRKLNNKFWRMGESDLCFLDPELEQRYRASLSEAGLASLRDSRIPVVCLFGTNLHYIARSDIWDGYRIKMTTDTGQFLSKAAFQSTFRSQIAGALAFHRHLSDLNIPTFSVLPPRRFALEEPRTIPDVFLELENMLIHELQAVGTKVIDHRDWSLDENGLLKPEYASSADFIHATLAYGKKIVQILFSAVG